MYVDEVVDVDVDVNVDVDVDMDVDLVRFGPLPRCVSSEHHA